MSPEQEALVLAYLPLVRRIVYRMQRSSDVCLGPDDLMGYGYVGLVRAAELYDPGRGVKFITLAWRHVHWAITDGQRLNDPLPRYARRMLKGTERERGTLEEWRRADETRAVSLDAFLERFDMEGDALDELADDDPLVQPDEMLDRAAERSVVRAALEWLDERDRELLRRRYVRGESQESVARRFGISPSRVSQLENRAIRRLRAALEIEEW